MHWHTGRYIRLIWCCIYRTAHITTCTALRTVCIDGWNVLSSMDVLDLKERERKCENLNYWHQIWFGNSIAYIHLQSSVLPHMQLHIKCLQTFANQGDAKQFKKFQIYGESKRKMYVHDNVTFRHGYSIRFVFWRWKLRNFGFSIELNKLFAFNLIFIIVFIAVWSFKVMKISDGVVNNADINKNGNATGKDGVKVSSLLAV